MQCVLGHGVQALFRHIRESPTKIMLLGGICSAATRPIAECAQLMNLVQVRLNKPVSVMRRTHERDTKARPLSFSGGPHAPVNMAGSIEEVNEGGEKRRKWHSRNVCSAVLRYISYTTFSQILEVLRVFLASLDPETVQLPAFYMLSAMFTGACGPPEKLSLALVPRLNVLRMIVKLACEEPEIQETICIYN